MTCSWAKTKHHALVQYPGFHQFLPFSPSPTSVNISYQLLCSRNWTASKPILWQLRRWETFNRYCIKRQHNRLYITLSVRTKNSKTSRGLKTLWAIRSPVVHPNSITFQNISFLTCSSIDWWKDRLVCLKLSSSTYLSSLMRMLSPWQNLQF